MDGIKPSPRSEPQGSICSDSYQFLSWLIIFSARNGEPQTPQQLCRRRVLCGVQRFNPTQQPIFNPGQEVIIPGVIFRKQPHVGFFLSPLAKSRSNSGRKWSPRQPVSTQSEWFPPFSVLKLWFIMMIKKRVALLGNRTSIDNSRDQWCLCWASCWADRPCTGSFPGTHSPAGQHQRRGSSVDSLKDNCMDSFGEHRT
jgi:hypothetical protein